MSEFRTTDRGHREIMSIRDGWGSSRFSRVTDAVIYRKKRQATETFDGSNNSFSWPRLTVAPNSHHDIRCRLSATFVI